MNWLNKVTAIKMKLEENNLMCSLNSIVEAQMALGTPGEMFSEVLSIITVWKSSNNIEYRINKEDIDDLIEYAKSINYL